MSSLRTRPVVEAAPSYRPEVLRTFDPPEPDEADDAAWARYNHAVDFLNDKIGLGARGGDIGVLATFDTGPTFRTADGKILRLPFRDDSTVLRFQERFYRIHHTAEMAMEAVQALRHFAADLMRAADVIEADDAQYR